MLRMIKSHVNFPPFILNVRMVECRVAIKPIITLDLVAIKPIITLDFHPYFSRKLNSLCHLLP